MTKLEATAFAPLHDPGRLAAIARLGLLERTRDEVFDRAARLASRLLGAGSGRVSIVTDEAQHLIGASGLSPEREATRPSDLGRSFCQFVVLDAAPLVVTDARIDPVLRANVAVEQVDARAYLGVPIRDADGHVLGSFCVTETSPREWTPEDLAILEDLADLMRTELVLRDQLELLQTASRIREDIVRTSAHDLRASLMAATGAARTLASGRAQDPELQTRLLEVAVHQGERADALLVALLDRARTAAGTLEPVDLAAVERIALNLVRNALLYTDGPVHVTTGTEDDLVVLVIRDAGAGLPAWLLEDDLGHASLR